MDVELSRRTSTTCSSSAPAAPGCARRSKRRRGGVTVGLVCKSLLGKAHTVMAEGGMAAAMGNVDDRDNWRVHFADTMRGGQYLNNWRMAELHAKEAPDRVRELEAWGALFDRTPDGRILQRNFGGHRYPRLAHVGDRTGLEMIRTLQDHGIHQGIDVHMECTVVDAAQGRRSRRAARSATIASAAASACSAPRPSCSRPAASAAPSSITSNSWEYTGDGHALAYHAGAELMDMEFVQFHPTGMVWPPSVRGILVTEGVRGEGGVLRNREGQRFMFDDIPDNYEIADRRQPGGGLALHAGRQERPPPARAADARSRRALHHARGAARAAAARTAASSSTSRGSRRSCRTRAEHIKKKLPSMYHQFKQLADIDITKEPMEVGPTTHYMMGGIRVDGDTQMSTVPGLFAAASAPPDCTARTGSAATRCRTCWCSASGRASTRRSSRGAQPAGTLDPTEVDDAARRRAGAVRARRRRRGGRTRCSTSCRT